MSNNKTVVYEGWMVRYGRRKIGKSFIHMRYFVLESQLLAYYKKKSQNNMVPIMTLHLDGNCRVEDRGLKTQQGHMVYVLSVYSKKEKQHPMTMAAFNIQEALTWKDKIQSVIDQHQESKPTLEDHFSSFETKSSIATESSDQETQSSVTEDENRAPPQDVLRRTTLVNANPPDFVYDWTKELDSNVDPQNPNNPVSSRKYWRLLQCQNGLRIFEGIIEGEFLPKSCSRAMKAVGVVEATCEEVFEVVMSMDPTRWEWDCSFRDGSLVEEVDGHTAILYHRLQLDWFPINGSKGFSSGCRTESALNRGEANWGLGFVWPRDLCYVRYWRRNDDGSYVVLFRSREHQNCPPQRGFVRAHIESGGYNISPLKPHNGKARTQVQLLMQMDLKGWGVGYLPAYQQHSLLQMLNSVAGLREFFSQTDGRPPAPRIPVLVNMTTVSSPSDDSQKVPSETTPPRHHRTPSLDQMHAANRNASLMDEYSDEDEDYQFADLEEEPEIEEKRVVDEPQEQIDVSIFSGNLPRDDGDNARDCWTISDGNNFRVRSKNFCTDKSKCDAGKHLMEFVAVDWFKDTKRMDHIARRSGCAAQVASAKGYFSIVVNLQVPGSTQYSMVFYFVAKRLIQGSLMQRFVDGDDEFRNSRLKLIPSVPKGSWIVRQSVGSSACLLGKAVDCNYYRGHNYLEIDVDIGSSTVANGVLGIVIGVIRTLVIDMAFLVQGNTPEELPERLIGAVRVCHLELASAEDISTLEVENSYNYNNKDEYYY